MRSVTNIVDSNAGTNASNRGNGVAENGAVTANAANKTAATKSANRRCRGVGVKFASDIFDAPNSSRVGKIASVRAQCTPLAV